MCGTIDMAISNSTARAPKAWWLGMIGAAMGSSLAVNAVVSALMITRIWFVHREAKSAGGTSESPLPLVVSMLLQSAVMLFFAQLVYLVLYELRYKFGNPGFVLVVAPIPLLYVSGPLFQSYSVAQADMLTRCRDSAAPPSWFASA
jgi:hypothetical protein